MDRESRDLDDEFESIQSIRSKSNYDKRFAYAETNNRSLYTNDQSPPSQQTYTHQNRDGRLRNLRFQSNDDDDGGVTSIRSIKDDPNEEASMGFQIVDHQRNAPPRETTNVPYQAPRQTTSSTRLYTTEHQHNLFSPSPQRTAEPTKQTPSSNPRSCMIDINITINHGGRTPQVSVDTNNVTSRSPSRPGQLAATTRTPAIRSVATIEDIRFLELDIRTPSRTGRLSTDGIIHLTPVKQSTNLSTDKDSRSPERSIRFASDGLTHRTPPNQPTNYYHDNDQ